MNLIEIKGVTHACKTKAGPFPVFRNLNISIPEGRLCAVIGPSGCGKSTLTRRIAGLMFPDQGKVWLHGERVTSPRKTVGMAFRNPVLLEWCTVLQNVMLPLEIVAPIAAVVILLTAWEWLVRVNDWPNYKMASPSDLWPAFVRFQHLFWPYAWQALWRTVAGLAVAVVFGTNLVEIITPHGRGPGHLSQSAQTNSDFPLMFAVPIAFAGLGIVRYHVVVALEKIFAGWTERPAH